MSMLFARRRQIENRQKKAAAKLGEKIAERVQERQENPERKPAEPMTYERPDHDRKLEAAREAQRKREAKQNRGN